MVDLGTGELRKGSWENEAIFLLPGLWVDRSNVKSFKRCNEFSGCTIEQECLPYDIKNVYNNMVNVKRWSKVYGELKKSSESTAQMNLHWRRV